MNSLSVDQLLNSTAIKSIPALFDNAIAFVSQSLCLANLLESIPESLHFDDFQWTLLHSLTLILIVNTLLIYVAWRVFGRNICDRFMKPATSKAIEELKASVSRLKLPKEHTPRI